MEKLAYALILASRKLGPYFQSHKVVRTAFPLRQVLHKPEASGRLMKWAVELGQFDVDYKPRTAIKGQTLADFFLEFPPSTEKLIEEVQEEPQLVKVPAENYAPWWTLYVDGAVNGNGAGAGIMLVSPEGHKLQSAIHFGFKETNNDAEYEALISGLKLAIEMKVENLTIFSDSMLVVGHLRGGFQARGPRTNLYMRYAQELMEKFKEVNLEQVPRSKNSEADALAKLGSQRESTLLGVIPLEVQLQPSVPKLDIMSVDVQQDTWITPIVDYITKGTLPPERDEARRLKYKSTRHVIYEGVLYKRGFNKPLLRCIAGSECEYIMREVHEGICGNHSGGTSHWHIRSLGKDTTGLHCTRMLISLLKLVIAVIGLQIRTPTLLFH